MYKAIIIDDEPKLREVLKVKIKKHIDSIQIVGEAKDIEDGFAVINKTRPAIVFLDIAMPGGTGFDLIDRFERIEFEIIFITGFNEYALDALKISAVDYLLKPVKTDELVSAVDKAIERLNTNEIVKDFAILKHNINAGGSQHSKIAIPSIDAYDFIAVTNIIRCEGWNKYTKVKIENRKEIISSYNVGVYKDMLGKFAFYSPHKSHVINTLHIVKYLKEGIIVMSDGSHIPLARRKKEEFLNTIISNKILR